MNDSWKYRKNLADVGTRCRHDTWWSEDCSGCIAEKESETRYS